MRCELLPSAARGTPRDLSGRFYRQRAYGAISVLFYSDTRGGARIGHPLDDKERPAILLEESLLDVSSQTVHDNQDLFSGLQHVDESRMGYACGRGTPTSPRGWGGDWCLFAYSYPVTQASSDVMRQHMVSAFMAFSERQFDVSFGAFSGFLNESALRLSVWVPVLATMIARSVVSRLVPEAGVQRRNICHNMAAGFRKDQDQQEMLKGLYYIDLAVTYDQTDDHIQGVRQLLTFLSLGSRGTAELMHKRTTLSIQITREEEETTSLAMDVSLCDDIAGITKAFCIEHAIC